MRKQEWIDAQVRRHTRNILSSDNIYDVISKAIQDGINHPEFEPDKPYYTYRVDHNAGMARVTHIKYAYTIFESGEYFTSCGYIFCDMSECRDVAQAIIEVLNKEETRE